MTGPREFHYAWVYPHEGAYVLSADVVTLAAVERGQVDYMTEFGFRFPTIGGAVDVNGPQTSMTISEDADWRQQRERIQQVH